MTRTSLTDRYLYAAARYLPETQRAEFRRELAERIADTVEAKQDAGATFADAEYAALAELGHPSRLAATYADRPLYLVGPRYFLLWRQLMTLMVPVIAVVAGLGSAVAGVADELTPAQILGSVVEGALSGAVWVAFGLTVAFAVIERYDPATLGKLDPAASWTPSQLPEPAAPDVTSRRDLTFEAVWLGVLGVVILLAQRFSSATAADGSRVRLFQAETWAWLRWALFAIVAAELVLVVVAIVRGRRGWWYAGVKVLLDVAACAVLIPPIAAGTLVDPAFLEAVAWQQGVELTAPGGVAAWVAISIVVVTCAADAVGAIRTAYREERATDAMALG